MALFDAFGDFLSLLFSKDPAASRVRRELRDARNFLKGVKPPIYKPSGNLVLPGFAQSAYAAAAALRPVRELLERSCLSSDQRLAKRSRDFLIERRLGPGALSLLESCSFESMSARAGGDPKMADSVAAAASEDFRVFLKGLEAGAAEAIEAELAEFERLADLCRYDFFRLLSPFDPKVNLESSAYKPRFQPADGRVLVGELAELHSVASGPAFGQSVVHDVAALAERSGGGADADAERRFSKSLGAVSKALSSCASSAVLTALTRVLREEPRYLPPGPEAAPPFVADYKERAEKRFSEARDRLLREARESALSADIAALFGAEAERGGAVSLIPVAGYDSQLDGRLRKCAGRSFAWMTPLTILKNFDARYLAPGLVEAGRKLAVEGFFNNGAVRSRLTDAVSRLEKCGARIAAFEETNEGPGRSGAPALRKLLDDAAKGADVSDAVERIAKGLDERAKDLVERDVAACRSLAEVVFDVIGDFRKPTPDLVTNIKTLAASGSKDLIPTLANGYNAIARLLKIMKAYMLVKPID